MSSDRAFSAKYGPWGIVTGCTSGIGAAMAAQLAEKGLNLVLVARRAELLRQLAENLERQYRIAARALPIDLAQPDATARLERATSDLGIGLLVVNAALEFHGGFFERDLAAHRQLLQVNVAASMELATVFGEKMRRAGRGGILFVSSLGGYTPQPWIAHYGASKAYLSSLGEALHYELKGQGVDVTVLAAGLTDTPMAAPYRGMKMPFMSPAEVAGAGLRALGKTPLVVPGLRNRMTLFLMSRLIPRKLAPRLTAAILKRTVLRTE